MIDNNISLKCYFKDLSKLSLIGGERQMELAIKAKAGDRQALEDLVEGNLRFVVTVAKEYVYSKIPLEDLINEGNIGLIKAVDKFDTTRKIKFISYAVWWIRQSIIQSIYETADTVRLPVNRINIKNKIIKARDILFKELDREPTVCEISDFSEISKEDISGYLTDCNFGIGLESKTSEENGTTVGDFLSGDGFESMEKTFNRNDASSEIDSVLSTLNKRESIIIKMYFGLNSNQEMNLREIGEELNLTNERVRQIKDFALKKLRTYGKSMKLREFLNCEI